MPLPPYALDGDGLTMVVTDQPSACAALQDGTRDPGSAELLFYLATTSAPDAGDFPIVTTVLGSQNALGDYPVGAALALPDGGYPGPGVRAATVYFVKPISSCGPDYPNEAAYGVSGTVTLTRSGGGATWYANGTYDAGPTPAASFDVVLNTGDHITGQFAAPVCGLLELPVDAGEPSCP